MSSPLDAVLADLRTTYGPDVDIAVRDGANGGWRVVVTRRDLPVDTVTVDPF